MPSTLAERSTSKMECKSIMARAVKQILGWACCLVLSFSGCQGGPQSFPSLTSLNNPTRVPPPPTGSYAAPQGYGAPAAGVPTSSTNLKPVGATLAQLRSIESGSDVGDVFGSEGRVSTNDVATGTIAARPVVAPPVRPSAAMTANPDLVTQAAAVSFSQPSAPPVITAGATTSRSSTQLSSSRPFESLPDPRSASIDSTAEISDGITWKTTQR